LLRSPRTLSALVWLAAALGAVSSVSELVKAGRSFPRRARAERELAERERRFRALRPALPRGEPVGYLSTEDGRAGDERATERYYRAAYGLAPVLLEYGAERRWVVGNFPEPPAAALLARRNLRLVRDFGDGLVLPERARAP
jgi:hypothetical protein